MGSRRRGDEPRRRLREGASGPERAPVSAGDDHRSGAVRSSCGARVDGRRAMPPPACQVHGSGRERRVRHRGAGDEDTCVRQMRNCLRSVQHTLHSRPVKPGERYASYFETGSAKRPCPANAVPQQRAGMPRPDGHWPGSVTRRRHLVARTSSALPIRPLKGSPPAASDRRLTRRASPRYPPSAAGVRRRWSWRPASASGGTPS
jgi:hypothetical protein